MDRFILYIPESCRFNDKQLLELCERNDLLRIETDINQNLIIMSPTIDLRKLADAFIFN